MKIAGLANPLRNFEIKPSNFAKVTDLAFIRLGRCVGYGRFRAFVAHSEWLVWPDLNRAKFAMHCRTSSSCTIGLIIRVFCLKPAASLAGILFPFVRYHAINAVRTTIAIAINPVDALSACFELTDNALRVKASYVRFNILPSTTHAEPSVNDILIGRVFSVEPDIDHPIARLFLFNLNKGRCHLLASCCSRQCVGVHPFE